MKKSGQQEGGEGWDKVGRLRRMLGSGKEERFPPLSGGKVLMTSPSSLSFFSFVIWGQEGQEMDRDRDQNGDLHLQQTPESQARDTDLSHWPAHT